jgi:hypothetical protein
MQSAEQQQQQQLLHNLGHLPVLMVLKLDLKHSMQHLVTAQQQLPGCSQLLQLRNHKQCCRHQLLHHCEF